MILNGCSILPITPDSNVLYLGAGSGTTASHVSEIATNGKVYCIEFSSRAFRDLLNVARLRKNMMPILESAFYPERYKPLIEKIDVIYQDISQRDQTRVFIKNAKQFLNPQGYGIYMIKSRSIDMTKQPDEIFRSELTKLRTSGFKVVEEIKLEPYTKDHLGVVLQLK
jgi:fibrillarin-like pre-rRNA processing protein